ncbi:MAG: hypothetical protein Q7S47_02650 [bacterium]|nr:hypothetical protein [bacterium]
MPTIGYVIGVVTDARMERLIDEAFESADDRRNFRRLRDIARAAAPYPRLLLVIDLIIGTVFLLALFVAQPLLGIIAAVVAGRVWSILVARKTNMRLEYNALMERDPKYWKPMAEKLKKLNAESRLYVVQVSNDT